MNLNKNENIGNPKTLDSLPFFLIFHHGNSIDQL